LDLRRKAIGIEGQGEFHVTLRLESGGHCGRGAGRTRPAGLALALRLGEASRARAVLPATRRRLLTIANFLGLRTASDCVS